MSTRYLDLEELASWQSDVDDCPDCQDGEVVCSRHDLDRTSVAERYMDGIGGTK